MTNEVYDVLSFIFGGNAEFTIKNIESQNEYKYKIIKAKQGNCFFVKVKNGSNYRYAGYIVKYNDTTYHYRKGDKGTLEGNDPAIKGILYALNKGHASLPRPMIMVHHCKCARCRRKLDDDKSIMRGFGPSCAKYL